MSDLNISFDEFQLAESEGSTADNAETTQENEENSSTENEEVNENEENEESENEEGDESEKKKPEGDTAEEGKEKKKPSNGLQKRFRHFTQTISKKDARIQQLEAELKETKKQYGLVDDDGLPVAPNPKRYPNTKEGERAYRDDYLKWDNQVTQLKGDKATQEQLEFENKSKKFNESVAKEKLKWNDFDDTVNDEFLSLPIQPHVLTGLMDMANGPDVMYALAKDPDLFIQINGLPVGQALIALGKVSTEMKSYVSKNRNKGKVTKAKKVPSKVNTGGSSEKNPDDMPMDEYVRYRNKQRQKE